MKLRMLAIVIVALLFAAIASPAQAMYHPGMGRFMQRDMLGYPDGMNRYAAYHVMHGGLDPTGLGWVEDQLAQQAGIPDDEIRAANSNGYSALDPQYVPQKNPYSQYYEGKKRNDEFEYKTPSDIGFSRNRSRVIAVFEPKTNVCRKMVEHWLVLPPFLKQNRGFLTP